MILTRLCRYKIIYLRTLLLFITRLYLCVSRCKSSVHVCAGSPQIYAPPVTTTVTRGSLLRLNCLMLARPAASVTWSKNNVTLSQNARIIARCALTCSFLFSTIRRFYRWSSLNYKEVFPWIMYIVHGKCIFPKYVIFFLTTTLRSSGILTKLAPLDLVCITVVKNGCILHALSSAVCNK